MVFCGLEVEGKQKNGTRNKKRKEWEVWRGDGNRKEGTVDGVDDFGTHKVSRHGWSQQLNQKVLEANESRYLSTYLVIPGNPSQRDLQLSPAFNFVCSNVISMDFSSSFEYPIRQTHTVWWEVPIVSEVNQNVSGIATIEPGSFEMESLWHLWSTCSPTSKAFWATRALIHSVSFLRSFWQWSFECHLPNTFL